MSQIVWISLDPTYGNINIYPKKIALLIEKTYMSINSNSSQNKVELELGSEYNNSTIHFSSCGEFYQTMPVCNLNQNNNNIYDFKTVKRCEVFKGIIEINIIKVYSGNWRISNKVDSKNSLIFRPNQSDIIITDYS